MADRSVRPGKHLARHRRRSRLDQALDGLPSLRRPAIATAASGVLAAGMVADTSLLADRGVDGPSTWAASAGVMEYDRPTTGASRTTDRTSLAELKAEAMRGYTYGASRGGGRVAVDRERLATADVDPRDIALAMLPQYGWAPASEFGCLDDLWYGESQWDPSAENPYSGAYGIPQALPAEKMAAAGPDWLTNPATQIEWGLGYIADRYGTPCAANDFKLANGWY